MRFVKEAGIDGLIPYEKNSRIHSEKDIEAVRQSISQFGWTNPILVQEGTNRVIAGHGRLLAAKRAGLTHVPVVFLEMSDIEARAYTIADNQLATLSRWDEEVLAGELNDLAGDGFNLDVLGFEDGFLADLIDGEGSTILGDPESAPPPPEKPVTRRGDLWLLGAHRLLCGDSTSPDDVRRLLGGATPFIMVTDPPYGVNYDASWRRKAGAGGKRTGKVLNDDRADWTESYKLFPGVVAYVWHGASFTGLIANNLEACGLIVRAQIVWVKSNLVLSRGAYHYRHEPCWYAVRQDPEPQWTGGYEETHVPAWYAVRKGETAQYCDDRTQTTVWEIKNHSAVGGAKDDADTNHSTQKPLECMARPIRNHGTRSDAVYDPFCGSGTTIIAAEQLHRVCYGMELSPAYCDVIVSRWENVTQQKARRLE